ncbi:unnamed protein product [Ixodes pacificus]
MKCVSRKAKVRGALVACFLVAVGLVLFYHQSKVSDQPPPLDDVVGHGAAASPHDKGDAKRTGVSSSQHSSSTRSRPQHHRTPFSWPWTKATRKSGREQCIAVPARSDVDIRTPDVFAELDFKRFSKSYWNQSFEKRYHETRQRWDKLPLQVIVIPHSHNDPGWLKTFEGYFLSNTAHILNNMVDFLTKNRDFSFLWAEVCFFSRWWRSLQNRPHLRDAVRRLVHRGQLEMVTGGWVMTDEAAAHYFAMVDQLVEGHQWLRTNLGVVPRNGWSIDPFGHGATMPYILQASGIRNTFVQRTHYAWKQFLAARRQLEFLWQPPFPTSSQRVLSRRNNSSGVLCHMAPFELYSIKHTCGPDPEVCLKFDFRRMAGEYTESRASIVNPNNVAELAKELLGQYGRIGSLFPHNVALVPLGDDFRFDRDAEWIQQHKNYRRLFDYINTNSKKLHANVRFGTLQDYFQEVHRRMEKMVSSAAVRGSSLIPTLEGDFHPYGDVYAEGTPSYWTGYYTTRPYLKHFCRELEHWLRAAEIIYSLARSYLHQTHMKELAERMDAEYVFLVQSRDSLGLFMHHDAITGTSKEGVMTDYGSRMFNGMKEAMGVVAHAAQFLLLLENPQPTFEGGYNAPHSMISYLFPDIDRQSFEVLPSKVPLTVPSVIGRKVVLYNSHAQHVQEVVRVHVKTLVTKVTSPFNSDIPFQINPVWDDAAMMSTEVFEVVFIAELQPLSLTAYTLYSDVGTRNRPAKTRVSLFVADAWVGSDAESIFAFESPASETIELETPYLKALFSHQTGLLTSIRLTESGIENQLNLTFSAYRSLEFHSGAYLFQPDASNPFINVTGRFPIVRVIRGPVASEVMVAYPQIVVHTFRVYHVNGALGGGLEMITLFDLQRHEEMNVELFMKLDTNINSDRTFFTDASGFQMMRRVTNVELPIEANYYPITSAAYLEDKTSRMTLVVSHAHGAASIQPGSLEVMLDRKLRYDDSRGLGEGVMDNRKTVARFWLMLEERRLQPGSTTTAELPNLSLLAHTLSAKMLYPPVILATEGNQNKELRPSLSFLNSSYPDDLWLLNLRTTPVDGNFDNASPSSLLILHQKAASCKVAPLVPLSLGGSSPADFKFVKVQSVHRTTLTGTRNSERVTDWHGIKVSPMELATFNVTFGA